MTRSRQRVAAWVAVIMAAAVGAGCSSDEPLSPRAYRREVQQVCRELARSTAALPSPEPTDTDRLVRVGRRALALERAALGEIQSFDAPAADEKTVGRWLDAVSAAVDASAESLDAQAELDVAAARAANTRGTEAAARADTIARDLGVPDCAAVPSAP